MIGTIGVGSPLAIAGLPGLLVVFLFVLAFLGGVVTSTLGPGGILLVIALYVLTPLTSAQVAGTSAGVFFIGVIVGTVSFARSNDIDYAFALVLALASLLGVRGGVRLNRYVSEEVFGLVLAVTVVAVGSNVLYRAYYELDPVYYLDSESTTGLLGVALLGLVIGCVGGLTGIGGAALSVPALVLLGIPIVRALAAGMVQGVFVTASTAASYASAGETIWILVLLFTVPYTCGIVVGWRIAHRVESRLLTLSLGGLLILLSGSIVVI